MFEFRDFIEYFIWSYGIEILTLILCSIFGCLGYAAKRIYQSYIGKQNDYLDDEAKRHIASAVVEFVEQAWKCLHGPEKLQKALETARVMLEKKGIDFDAEEMTVLIEACLAEFNEAFKKPLLDGSTAAATYRPYEGPQQSDETTAQTE